MSDEAAARWTVTVSRDTDLALRAYLGSQGMRKGDLSKFIEDAVRWRMFDQTVQGVKARNGDLSAEELQEAIDEACAAVRLKAGPPSAAPR